MKTVWKYRLLMDDYGNTHKMELPKGAQVLSFGLQPGGAYLWALVDPEETKKDYRNFIVVGTGQNIQPQHEPNLSFIGTAFVGEYVFHSFEVLDA